MAQTTVVPVIKGGLGNQLFQIAAAFNYASQNQFLLLLPETSIIHYHLGKFKANGNQIDHYRSNILSSFNFGRHSNFKYKFVEKTFSFSPIPRIDGDILLEGYFQSEKYFIDTKAEIYKRFKVSENAKDLIGSRYPTLNLPTSVAVHVRRGDAQYAKTISPMLQPSYYRRALECLDTKGDIFVFTDDAAFCLADFARDIGLKDRRVIRVRLTHDFEELWAISLARNIIIANSTFSWWAAYLSPVGTRILRPSRWFGHSGPIDTFDLFPSNWTEVSVNYYDDKFF
jgi:hypothetical protein